MPREFAWCVFALLALSVSGAPQSERSHAPSAARVPPIQRRASVANGFDRQTPAVAAPRGRSLAAEASSVAFDAASPSSSMAHVSELTRLKEKASAGAAHATATVGRSVRQRRKAIREDIYYWPEAVIPYSIDSTIDGISTEARSKIEKAMAHWEQTTCVRFVPYNATAHSNSLVFLKGHWCASKLGMTGGPQPLYLAAGCLTIGTIVHEIGHSVGWVHEQTRPDRDEHVDIKWSVISPLYRPQYDKYSSAYVNTYGIPYDHSSIMHYPSYGELSSRDSSKQAVMGQRERLSFYDAKLANVMYKCAERRGCDTSGIECAGDGYVGPDCKCVCPDGSARCTSSNEIGMPVMDAPAELPAHADEDAIAAAARAGGPVQTRKQQPQQQQPQQPQQQQPNVETTTAVAGTTTAAPASVVTPVGRRYSVKCSPEYTNVRDACLRIVSGSQRPAQLAAHECKNRLQASLWNYTEAFRGPLAHLLPDGEYWVNVEDYKSDNSLAGFFRFCPYLLKENGAVVLSDNFCHRKKGFICVGEPVRTSLQEARSVKKAYAPAPAQSS